jgi:hypothetical protein
MRKPDAPAACVITLELLGEDGLRIRATFPIELSDAFADYVDAAQRMTASDIEVGPHGFALTLVNGKLLLAPPDWCDWWATAGVTPCSGVAALAAVGAQSLWGQGRARHRGEHGPPVAGIEESDNLLSAALVGIAQNLSYRAAVAAAFEQYKPDASAADEAALLRRVTRFLRGAPDLG